VFPYLIECGVASGLVVDLLLEAQVVLAGQRHARTALERTVGVQLAACQQEGREPPRSVLLTPVPVQSCPVGLTSADAVAAAARAQAHLDGAIGHQIPPRAPVHTQRRRHRRAAPIPLPVLPFFAQAQTQVAGRPSGSGGHKD
jgi:hypothetical protein